MSDTPEQPSVGLNLYIGQTGISGSFAKAMNAGNAFNNLPPNPSPVEAAPTHVDVTGQLGGPHPDEQASVDAEQVEIMKRIRAEPAAAAQAERAAGNDAASKIERANRNAVSMPNVVKRIEALEAKNG